MTQRNAIAAVAMVILLYSFAWALAVKSEKVDLNMASGRQLESLPGIGPGSGPANHRSPQKERPLQKDRRLDERSRNRRKEIPAVGRRDYGRRAGVEAQAKKRTGKTSA